MKEVQVVCDCGAIIPDKEFDHSNRCNEEGEDWHEITAHCPNCKRDYEASDWGEFDDLESDKLRLLDHYRGVLSESK